MLVLFLLQLLNVKIHVVENMKIFSLSYLINLLLTTVVGSRLNDIINNAIFNDQEKARLTNFTISTCRRDSHILRQIECLQFN